VRRKNAIVEEDCEYYRFRLREIKDKYDENSSDEEDVVRKVLRSNRPCDKPTDVHDLEDYMNGLPVEEFKYDPKFEGDLRRKADELEKQRKRKFPVTVE
jgi:hypothetical protein